MLIIALFAMLGFAIFTVNGASGIAAYYVGSGEAYEVMLDGQIRLITNNTAHTIFIPTQTLTEQQSFLNNAPSGVIIQHEPTCTCSPTTKTYGDAAYTIGFTTNSTGTKSYSSGTTSVATINSSGLVTIVGAGTSTMTCNVAATTNYKATSCTGTQTVNKGSQAAPAAPTMSSNTVTSIILNACSGGGCEYRRDSGSWQTSTTFSGLTAGTSYSFTQRKAATTNYNASAESSVANISTADACNGLTTMTDSRDGQSYPIKGFGTQCWMTKNLNYATGASWCYSNNTANCNTYGRLYDWSTATSACPSGWHLPSDAEFTTLGSTIGSAITAWVSTSGWHGLYGGYLATNGSFYGLGTYGRWWSSTPSSSDAWVRLLHSSNTIVVRGTSNQGNGWSVRCLRN